MNHRLRFIFLSVVICYHTGTRATLSDTVREKTNYAYVVACEKTRALYEEIKKHRKIIAGCFAYLAFECIGYAHDWDTPLRRLVTPKKLLDDAQVTINGHVAHIAHLQNTVAGQAVTINQQEERIANITDAHQVELQQQEAYRTLRTQCEELKEQLRVFNEEQKKKREKERDIRCV